MDEKELREIIFDRLKPVERKRESNRISVTDLTWCLRRNYFKRFYPVRMSLEDCLRMARGRALHDLILKFGEREKHIEIYDGDLVVSGYIDVVFGTTVLEFKSVKSTKGVDEYTRQLKYYMSMLGYQRGFVVMHNIFNDKLVFEKVKLSKTALRAVKKEMLSQARLLSDAIKAKDFTMLPKTFADGFCEICPYQRKCLGVDVVRQTN